MNDANNDLHQSNPHFEPDVTDLAHQLENTDFSGESAIRASLREQIIHQAQTQARNITLIQLSESLPRSRHNNRFSPVYALAGIAAAVVMFLMVVIAKPPAMSAVTPEASIVINPMSNSTASPTLDADTVGVAPYIHLNLESLWYRAPLEVYAPANLPDGYTFISGSVFSGDPVAVEQVYMQLESWQQQIQAGDPYSDSVDYLYIRQQPAEQLPAAGESKAIPANLIVPRPSVMSGQNTTYTIDQDDPDNPIFYAEGEGHIGERDTQRVAHFVTRRDNKFLIQIWSYHLDVDALKTIASSMTSLNDIAFFNLPTTNQVFNPFGKCDPQPVKVADDQWQPPLENGAYIFEPGFSASHPGVNLKALPSSTQTNVLATRDGEIIYSGSSNGLGDVIVINHGDGYTVYTHLHSARYRCGYIAAGQSIATLGTIDDNRTAGVYFEIRDGNRKPIDPASVINLSPEPAPTFIPTLIQTLALRPIETDAPGSCGLDSFPDDNLSPSGWHLPLQARSYSVVAGFTTNHSGIDLEAPEGTDVFAAENGMVVFAGQSNTGRGLMVALAHSINGNYDTYTLYAHLKEVNVNCGQVVAAGEKIGTVGATGNASGPHLHFEVQDKDGNLIDPTTILDF
ncbi:MAG TPA: M23 family metallopeptidase [Phototrophicaceae bacterium]|jgi:murein DD-endopeptidase MepM/ murein hydrolase activator NlpD|nr:M23 family metallopeptidase [Phototrophicaceae bacterium]